MSLTKDIGKGGYLEQIIPLFLVVHKKRKRHIGKQREGKSVRQSMRQRGLWETGMRGQREVARHPWTQMKISCRLLAIW
jgi:hypothetical protein